MKIAIPLVFGLGIIVAYLFYTQARKPSGTIIVLNGPSGAGKTSIQKEFQNSMMPNLWLKVGIDNLFDNPMPEITPENMHYWQSPNPIRWVTTSQDDMGNKIIALHVGAEGEKAIYAMHSAIAAYAQSGCNLIVDYIAYKQEWFKDLQEKLKNYNVYYVAVDISLETLEKREAARGTSPAGHARSHYFDVYGAVEYSMRVSSEKNSAQEIAQQLKDLVNI